MPLLIAGEEDAYQTVVSIGPVAQVFPNLPVALPATIAASGSWQSGIINADGFKALACGVTSTQAGALSVQRFIDQKGLVPVSITTSAALSANTAGSLYLNDGVPFASFQVTITNTGGSAATLSAFALLLNAA